jgi:hypothetical protein
MNIILQLIQFSSGTDPERQNKMPNATQNWIGAGGIDICENDGYLGRLSRHI